MLIRSRRRHHDPLSCGLVTSSHELLHRVDLPMPDSVRMTRTGSKQKPQPMKHRSIHSAPARTVRQKFSGTISGYHERCFAHWIPAPAKTTPKTRKVRKPRPDENFPLCLVCDRDASDVESSFECLVEKFDRSVKRLEEMEFEVERQSSNQRAKVLHDLWKMDDHGVRPTKKTTMKAAKPTEEASKKKKDVVDLSDLKVDTRKNKSDDSNWKDLFENGKSSTKKRSKEEVASSGSNSPRNDHLDLDLVPDRDWSSRSSNDGLNKSQKVVADVHNEQTSKNAISSKKREQFKTKRLKTFESMKDERHSNEDHNGERDIMKEFVDQSFERERKRQQERESKKAEREPERDIIKEFVDQSFEREKQKKDSKVRREKTEEERDIIREFVYESFEREERAKRKESIEQRQRQKTASKEMMVSSPKRELVECLQKIDLEVPGKLIDPKNLNNVAVDDDDATNVSISLSSETLKSENGHHLSNRMIKRSEADRKFARSEAVQPKKSAGKLNRADENFTKTKSRSGDEDVFLELVIDELKRENRELKFALVAREEKLMDAASKVREIVEENAMLSKRLEKSLRRENQLEADIMERQRSHDERVFELSSRLKSMESKMSTIETSKTLLNAADVESALNDLKRRLAESEATNDNLKTYIENLKKSYQTVFGAGNGTSSPSSISANP